MSAEKVKLKLSKATAECIRADAPKDMRLIAAEGRLPVEPNELITALFYLLNDKDEEVKAQAKKSLGDFPRDLLTSLLSSPDTHPRIIDYLSRLHSKEKSILELIVQNSATENKTIERIAQTADPDLLDTLAKDVRRIRSCDAILEAIKKNPSASKELTDRVESALAEPDADEDFPEELIKEKEGGGDEGEDEEDDRSLYAQILDMGVSQKIKLAITGNKEARSILVKDPNRLICGNVMKNPRITESEVLLHSASKSVGEEVFRLILANRDWMKNYQIKVNLVNNPRVPLPTAINLLNHLRTKDLELVSNSRNVSKGVANMAKRMLISRREKKK